MDLGIRGRRAVVCASSQGLGLACATALAREGCEVVINGRDAGRLAAAQAAIAADTGARVHAVAADISTEAGRQALFDACPNADILVNNNAGPPPGKLADWDHAAWLAALEANMLAPILLIRAFLPGMRERKCGRIVNITSAMVKSPRPHMALSTTARTGVTAFSKAVSIEAAADTAARLLQSHPAGFTMSQFREALGTSRKHAVPLATELDARGITRRRDDVRIAGPKLPLL